jgi:simple sugar transport system ATP-binding protein
MVPSRPGPPVLELSGISRAYGQIQANDAISLTVERGEILGLLGENGAGKSTLLSILAGLERADAGTVRIEGEPVHPSSSARSIRHGISLVHQHFSLVPTFTVTEQLRLAGWKRPTLPAILGDDIAADVRIEQLAPGQQQRVELAKALVRDPRILLLDEPTSILAPSEVAGLFATLDQLRNAGTAVVFVTHKIREVLARADRIVVLRRGRVSGTFERLAGEWPAGTERQAIAAMFDTGEDRVATTTPSATPIAIRSTPVLSATALSTIGTAGTVGLRDVDVAVRTGEVHAIVGIDGQGQGTLADVLAGYQGASGRIDLAGHSMLGLDAEAFAAAGIGFITGERLRDGGIGAFAIADNLLLKRQRSPEFARRGMIRSGQVIASARTAIRQWNIRPPDPAFPFGSLSGGNMQKVLLARELARQPRVVIAVNPVAGLDVQTALDVRDCLRAFVRDGGAALWFTNDLDDAMVVADTISIIFEGRLSTEMLIADASVHRVSEMMVSGW